MSERSERGLLFCCCCLVFVFSVIINVISSSFQQVQTLYTNIIFFLFFLRRSLTSLFLCLVLLAGFLKWQTVPEVVAMILFTICEIFATQSQGQEVMLRQIPPSSATIKQTVGNALTQSQLHSANQIKTEQLEQNIAGLQWASIVFLSLSLIVILISVGIAARKAVTKVKKANKKNELTTLEKRLLFPVLLIVWPVTALLRCCFCCGKEEAVVEKMDICVEMVEETLPSMQQQQLQHK